MLLDAAAFVPANTLDLSRYHPDFTVVSWYKVFGHPTGVGSLIARRDALARLRRPWFSGGTIYAVSAQAQWHVLADDEAAFEDGTVNFLSVPDVTAGLDWIDGIGMDRVHAHVTALTGRLLAGLTGAAAQRRLADGQDVRPVDLVARGGTVALNLLGADGRSSTNGSSPATAPGAASPCAPAASATRARARRPSPCRRADCARPHAAKSRSLEEYLALLAPAVGGRRPDLARPVVTAQGHRDVPDVRTGDLPGPGARGGRTGGEGGLLSDGQAPAHAPARPRTTPFRHLRTSIAHVAARNSRANPARISQPRLAGWANESPYESSSGGPSRERTVAPQRLQADTAAQRLERPAVGHRPTDRVSGRRHPGHRHERPREQHLGKAEQRQHQRRLPRLRHGRRGEQPQRERGRRGQHARHEQRAVRVPARRGQPVQGAQHGEQQRVRDGEYRQHGR